MQKVNFCRFIFCVVLPYFLADAHTAATVAWLGKSCKRQTPRPLELSRSSDAILRGAGFGVDSCRASSYPMQTPGLLHNGYLLLCYCLYCVAAPERRHIGRKGESETAKPQRGGIDA